MKLFFIILSIIVFSGCSFSKYDIKEEKNTSPTLKIISILEDYYHVKKDVYLLFNMTTKSLFKDTIAIDMKKLLIKKNDSLEIKKQKIEEIYSNVSKKIFLKAFLDNFDSYTTYIDYSKDDTKIYKPKELSSRIDNKNKLIIKIPYFTKETSTKLKTIIQSHLNIKEIIIDLRDNPGGYLKDTITSIDLFIERGNIITVDSRRGKRTYTATKNVLARTIPIIIYINKNTASAAEIFAGVLHKLNRADIIGGEMYGKRTIQALFYLNEQKTKALKITTSTFSL